MKKFSLLQKLQLKIVAIVVCSVLAILLIVDIIACSLLANSDFNEVDQKLHQANLDVVEQNYSQEFDMFDHLLGQIKPPDDDRGDDRSRQYIGGEWGKEPSPIPTVTFYLQNNKLVETDNGIMSAYISDEYMQLALPTIVNSQDGTHNIPNLGLTFRKDTIQQQTYVAITSINFVSQWKDLANILIVASLIILIIVAITAFVLARKVTGNLQRAWDNQERFIADASHDLKTPLTIILTNSGIIKRNKDKKVEEVSEWIDNIEEEALNMQGLTNTMLDLAKIEEHKDKDYEKLFADINLSKIVKTVCLQMDVIAFEQKLNFSHDIQIGIILRGVEESFKRIATTLVENAFKHAVADDKISVKLIAKNKSAILSVKNEKSYIAEDDIPYIFERFHHSNENKKFTSHGLGLSIAKRLTEQMRGSISVASNKTNGTIFMVEFPRN